MEIIIPISQISKQVQKKRGEGIGNMSHSGSKGHGAISSHPGSREQGRNLANSETGYGLQGSLLVEK